MHRKCDVAYKAKGVFDWRRLWANAQDLKMWQWYLQIHSCNMVLMATIFFFHVHFPKVTTVNTQGNTSALGCDEVQRFKSFQLSSAWQWKHSTKQLLSTDLVHTYIKGIHKNYLVFVQHDICWGKKLNSHVNTLKMRPPPLPPLPPPSPSSKTSMKIKIFVISQVQMMDTRYLLLHF